jgi:MFS family permease
VARDESVTYEELPALAIRGRELRGALRIVTMAWMFGTVWMVCAGGTAVLNLGYLAGFTDFHWGVWTAVGFAATLAQLPGSYHVERTGHRKRLFMVGNISGRLLWMVLGLLAVGLMVLPNTAGTRLSVSWLAVFVILGANGLGHLGTPSWNTWMADLIPARIRGRFFARRNVYCISVQIVATVALGLLLDRVSPPAVREQIQNGVKHAKDVPWLVWTLLGIFMVAGVMGTLDIWLFRGVREIYLRSPRERIAPWEIVLGPLREKRFRRYVLSLATVTFGVALSMPFCGVHCQKHLGFNNLQAMIVLMLWGPFGSLISSPFWGRVTDRWGGRPILAITTVGIAMNIWGWLLMPPNGQVMAAVVNIFGGIAWCGYGIARTNMDFGFIDKGGRSTYGASTNVILAASGVVGALLGGALARWTEGFSFYVGSFEIINYHLVFAASGVFRLGGLFWLIGMPEPGAKPVGMVARRIAQGVLHNVPVLVFAPLRMIIRPVRRLVFQAAINSPRPPAQAPPPEKSTIDN